ncbi:flagellin N-terminal helical domain-containing protein [Lysinibacillus fusiformis]|uniref:flagellin N-terminal helical domain-containing protein n=1 Tax=Lysinibacillus sp. PWR01 TaxID=3342384 RepID=UPI00372CF9C5
MRINTNIAALNTHRQLTNAANAQSKSMEKLSSGFAINRAADDAAGLSISEKMRAQIRGLEQAGINAQDGISLIQTADGALGETQEILKRMRQLATKSADGTKTEDDRQAYHKELEQLKTEIDRISESTEFNTKKLLNGDLSKDGSLKVGGNVVGVATVVGGENPVTATKYQVNGGTTDSGTGQIKIEGAQTSALNDVKLSFKLGADTQDPTAYYDADKKELVITLSAKMDSNTDAKLQTAIGTAIKSSGLVEKASDGKYYYKSTGDEFQDDGSDFKFTGFDTKVTAATDKIIKQEQIDELNKSLTYLNGAAAVTGAAGFAEKFQIGDKPGDTLTIAFTQMKNKDGDTVNDLLNGYTFKFVAGNQSYIQTAVDDHDKTITVALSSEKTLNTADDIKNALKGLVVNGVALDDSNMTFTVNGTGDLAPGKGFDGSKFANQGKIDNDGLTLQIGANNASEQRLKLNIEDMSAKALEVNKISVATQKGGADAISVIDKALAAVSSQRATFGAVQNRLTHTIKNLETTGENLSAAESRIREVDMAKEMMEQTKNSILSQAAQAMLAQANQQPQGVLQLLR